MCHYGHQHSLSSAFPRVGSQSGETIPVEKGREVELHPGQATDPSQGTHTTRSHTHT